VLEVSPIVSSSRIPGACTAPRGSSVFHDQLAHLELLSGRSLVRQERRFIERRLGGLASAAGSSSVRLRQVRVRVWLTQLPRSSTSSRWALPPGSGTILRLCNAPWPRTALRAETRRPASSDFIDPPTRTRQATRPPGFEHRPRRPAGSLWCSPPRERTGRKRGVCTTERGGNVGSARLRASSPTAASGQASARGVTTYVPLRGADGRFAVDLSLDDATARGRGRPSDAIRDPGESH
jgi:hypothetical protein